MKSDIQIAQAAKLLPILALARDKLGVPEHALFPYGHHKAKLALDHIASLADRPSGKLVLVTAISPTPAGEGKTTTTIGLGDALSRIGKRTIIALREPSLGPVFGMKGGAAGGGHAQVVPMEDINLHFTGDFHAISLAHNLLAALIDNHIHHGNALGLDPRRVSWRRVIDMNDRALRDITIGLGGPANGLPREDGFDIVAASEVMAVLCLSTSLRELKVRLGNIVIGETYQRRPVKAHELGAAGAMAVLLKEALAPNLVQTLENTPAIIHGGPFGNIAHGCNSAIGTHAALKLGEFVVTEAGFGADLGAEKFVDIKCRKVGLRPDCAVLVATVRALKYHGGVDVKALGTENLDAVDRGLPNLERHLNNLRNHFGLPCVIALNRFAQDSPAELERVRQRLAHHNAPVVVAEHFARGGVGAEDLAHAVVEMTAHGGADLRFAYDDETSLWNKMKAIATKIYGASEITADTKVRAKIKQLEQSHGHYPVCVAKTQYSFSTDPLLRGAPSQHVVNIREVRLAAGAEFVVMICGDVMTMPGLPSQPAAASIDLDDDGRVVGLF